MAEVDVRRGGVHAELHAQRPALLELALELALGQGVDGVAGEETGRLARGIRHGANARLPPSLGARPIRRATGATRRQTTRTDRGNPSAGALTATCQEPPTPIIRRTAHARNRFVRLQEPPPPPGPRAAQAEAEEAAPGGRAGGHRRAGPDLHGVRDAHGGGQRPALAREQGRVPGGRELDPLRRRAGLQGPGPLLLPDRQADRQPQPHPRPGGRHLAQHQERRDRDRGPALLPARGRGLHRHRARPVAGHPAPLGRPGRLHDHPAVREERPLRPGRPLGLPEAARVGAGLPPRAQVVEGEDPHPVPEHRLLRQRRLRHRVGGAHLLRRRRRARGAPDRQRRRRRGAAAHRADRGGGARCRRARGARRHARRGGHCSPA